MDATLVVHLGRRMMETALLIAGPALAVTLVLGFVVAMLQAVTSVRDMTLGLVVKLAGVGLTLLLCGGWMMDLARTFTREIFNHMQAVGH